VDCLHKAIKNILNKTVKEVKAVKKAIKQIKKIDPCLKINKPQVGSIKAKSLSKNLAPIKSNIPKVTCNTNASKIEQVIRVQKAVIHKNLKKTEKIVDQVRKEKDPKKREELTKALKKLSNRLRKKKKVSRKQKPLLRLAIIKLLLP